MTTIAFDGKTMASDSQQTGQFIDNVEAVKIKRFGGMLIGMAGRAGDLDLFINFLDTGEKSPLFDTQESEALVIVDGEALYYGCNLQPVPTGIPAAIGSGSGYAMAAMYCGKTAEEAVNIAARLDTNTGGSVKAIHL